MIMAESVATAVTRPKGDSVRPSYADDPGLIEVEMASLAALRKAHVEQQPSVDSISAQRPTKETGSGIASRDVVTERLRGILPAGYSWQSPPQSRFITSQKWEGTVAAIAEDTFIAKLRDLTNRTSTEQEEAELPKGDISPDDLELFKVGAHFYFSVGYRISESGSYERSSRIRFRRLPQWSANEIVGAFQRAKEIVKRFLIE